MTYSSTVQLSCSIQWIFHGTLPTALEGLKDGMVYLFNVETKEEDGTGAVTRNLWYGHVNGDFMLRCHGGVHRPQCGFFLILRTEKLLKRTQE